MLLVIGILISIIAAAIAVSVAKEKGRENDSWGVIAFIFPPALLFLLLAPKKTGTFNRECPYCKEVIKRGAIVCRYCGKDIVSSEPEPPPKTETPIEPNPEPKFKSQDKVTQQTPQPPLTANKIKKAERSRIDKSLNIIVPIIVISLLVAFLLFIAINQYKNPSESNPENIIKSRLKEPESWKLRSLKYKDGILICGNSVAVWYAKGERIYAVNGVANQINTMEYEFVSSENSPELGTSISDIVAVCER